MFNSSVGDSPGSRARRSEGSGSWRFTWWFARLPVDNQLGQGRLECKKASAVQERELCSNLCPPWTSPGHFLASGCSFEGRSRHIVLETWNLIVSLHGTETQRQQLFSHGRHRSTLPQHPPLPPAVVMILHATLPCIVPRPRLPRPESLDGDRGGSFCHTVKRSAGPPLLIKTLFNGSQRCLLVERCSQRDSMYPQERTSGLEQR